MAISHNDKVKMHALEVLREARAVWKADGQISMDQALNAVTHFYNARNLNSLIRAINQLSKKTGVEEPQ